MALQDAPTAQQIAQQIPLWIPVATFIIGQLFAIVLEWLRGVATARRERAARNQTREQTIEDRRAEFQRETLLELQTALERFTVAARGMRPGPIPVDRALEPAEIPEHVRIEIDQAHARIAVLQARVLDEHLRDRVVDVIEAGFALQVVKDVPNLRKAFHRLAQAFEIANEQIGELLRKLY
jgi:hypothetical protein